MKARNAFRFAAVVTAFLVASPASAQTGKRIFKDYDASASSLIAALNTLAGDAERLEPRAGNMTPEKAAELVAKLIKAREGFAAIITYDEHTNELNEGYILYIDGTMLALSVYREYLREGGVERLERVQALLAKNAALRAKLNATVRSDRKRFGLE
jgi:hypothetical protein